MARSIRHPQPVWQRHIVAAGLFLLLLGGLSGAQAATQEYTVLAVGVDHDSNVAAEDALEYARARAVYLAAKKLGIADPAPAIAKIPREDLSQIVRGATVTQTKRDGERTYEEVRVTIVEEALRKSLKLGDMTPEAVVVPMRSILVLPAYVTEKGTVVWQKENLLRNPLGNALLREGRGVIILPAGDLQDLRLVDGENITKVKVEDLKPMFDRYGADEIVIAIAQLGEAGTANPSHVILRRLNPQSPHDEVLDIAPATPAETTADRLAATAQNVANAVVQIAASTSETEVDRRAKATKIPVKFVYSVPRDYAQMSEMIRKAPGVIGLDLPEIGVNNVAGTIYLNGDKTELHKALAAQGIVVRETDGVWILSVR